MGCGRQLRANSTLAPNEYRGPVLGLIFLAYAEHRFEEVRPELEAKATARRPVHLINAFGHAPVTRTRARIAVHDGREICRVDVARSSQPVWAKTSNDDRVFFVRINNSTRALPDAELAAYFADRWPE